MGWKSIVWAVGFGMVGFLVMWSVAHLHADHRLVDALRGQIQQQATKTGVGETK